MKKSHGTVDAFGLNEFGQPAGLNPVWGAVVGTGLGTLGAIGARRFSAPGGKMGEYSELVGFALGTVASGAMLAFEGTRAAGWTGLASAFLNNGLRQLETMFPPEAAPVAGMRGVVVDRTQSLLGARGTGMGMVEIDPTQSLMGAKLLGRGGSDDALPTLVGANLGAANEHVQLIGGPGLAQHAGHWGATVIPS